MRLKNCKTAAAGRPHSLHVCRVNLCCSRKLIPTLLQELKRSIQRVKRGKQPIIQHVWALYSSKKEKKKLSPAASCATICMKKGPSKNIFLSFQAISLIPDELQGRGKCYGCGLAGGKGGILWQRLSVCVSMHVNMSWSEYICITEKVCLMAAFFYYYYLYLAFLFIPFVFGSMCICVWAWIIGNEAGTRGLCHPPPRSEAHPRISSSNLLLIK